MAYKRPKLKTRRVSFRMEEHSYDLLQQISEHEQKSMTALIECLIFERSVASDHVYETDKDAYGGDSQ